MTAKTRMVTVIRPANYPRDYQFRAGDYMTVPLMTTRNTFPLAEVARFNVENATAENVDMFITAFEKMQKGKGK